ncbi:hypothetical protein J0695_33425, partial [Streptomyces beijiangensis]|nr:hypothetical protein [Streptomyces beijiangensis]
MTDAKDGGRRGTARLVCGRRTKWLVLGVWLVVIFAAFPLASKLTGAQNNDANTWLPGSAESTQVLTASDDYRPQSIPAVVVYARADGLTAADRTRIGEDAAAIRKLTDHGILGGDVQGPSFNAGGSAAQLFVPVSMGDKGWERIAPAVDSIRDVTGASTGGLAVHITGPGGISADFSDAF